MDMKERRAIEAAYKALCVIYLDPRINQFLRSFDPKALMQVQDALTNVENNVEGIEVPGARAREYDFEVENHSSIYLLRPLTAGAHEWVEGNLNECNWFGSAIAVEHRYIADIVNGIKSDGLTVS